MVFRSGRKSFSAQQLTGKLPNVLEDPDSEILWHHAWNQSTAKHLDLWSQRLSAEHPPMDCMLGINMVVSQNKGTPI